MQSIPPLRIPLPPLSRRAFHDRWHTESGYREVLQLAWPLFFAMGSSTILQFIDRMFLTWYSPQALAAAGPSGMLAFTIQALFLGLVGYTLRLRRAVYRRRKAAQAVASVWQALYLAILASLLIRLLRPLASWSFGWPGHPPAVRGWRRTFFTILLYGSFVFIGSSALSAYFVGKGLTRIVLWVNLVDVAMNIVLDYLLIFGNLGAPRLGISGAGLASVTAQGVGMLSISSRSCVKHVARPLSAGAWKPDADADPPLSSLWQANGVQFALDMVGWTTFLLLVGHLGVSALGASNLAFQLNSLAFFPIIGFRHGRLDAGGAKPGENRPELADRAVWSAIHLEPAVHRRHRPPLRLCSRLAHRPLRRRKRTRPTFAPVRALTDRHTSLRRRLLPVRRGQPHLLRRVERRGGYALRDAALHQHPDAVDAGAYDPLVHYSRRAGDPRRVVLSHARGVRARGRVPAAVSQRPLARHARYRARCTLTVKMVKMGTDGIFAVQKYRLSPF